MSTPNGMPNVARAGGIMMISLFLSRVLGIARDTAMSATFGMNEQTDAYRLAFQLPDLLFYLVAGGALSSAFIPVFSEYLYTEREDEAWHIFSVVTTLMSIVVLAFVVAAWVFALPLSQWLAPSAEVNHIRGMIVDMSRIVLPAQFAFFIGGLMFGTLYARQKFVAPGMGPNIYNVGIIFGALVLSQFFSPGIYGMSWGALAGAVVGNLVVPLLVMRKMGSRYKPSLDWRHPGVKKVFALMLPVILGLSLPGVYSMIMQAFASYFPRGVNTVLDLSNKLMQAPLGVFGQSLAIAAFPALTLFYAQQRMDRYRLQLASTLRTVLYIVIPVVAVMLVMAPEIVTVFFAWGRSSKSAAVGMVADSLQLFSIGLVAWCMQPILMKGFFAVQNTVTPIVCGTITTGVFVVLIYLLMKSGMDYRCLPLAGSLSAIFLAALMLFLVRRPAGGIDMAGIALTFGKSLLAASAMAALLLAVHAIPVPDSGSTRNLVSFLKVLGGGLVGAWVYYGITKAMGMPETNYVKRALGRKRPGDQSEVPEGGPPAAPDPSNT